mmetsp:Transcript_10852/g.20681  ORF Transcript_10852/g.20681 Transcript_10852/m.20681 type:complete len:88 (+) Transcript_10852:181-444(+)|eukprot:CAMPEP_0197449148 /NCGR_PEP_ID=MMETSP1175-20131217/20174_1 /TAXON_ID=1003142 /ORGANISM="Triceratium dubium, Strain CCMP147" /LENGTH=87 /DNA_ID=CAMNT_0042981173 /DNA_START=168 /DNA_END=431 /DNA_ORIENTATION=+
MSEDKTESAGAMEKIGDGAKAAATATGDAIKGAGEGIAHAATHPKETAKKAVDATILSPYGTNVDGRLDADKIVTGTVDAYKENQTK